MALFSGLGSKVKSRVDALRQRFNKKALVEPKQIAAKPVAPKITTKTVDFKPSVAFKDEPLSFQELSTRAKMNRNRAARKKLNKHNKHMRKMNPQHGRRS